MLKRFAATLVTLSATAVIAGLLAPSEAAAQGEQYLELLRTDIRTKKVAIITEVMQFADEEGTAFWPIYREYDLELSKLGDRRVALIKMYAENYEAMTDEASKTLADDWFKLQEDRLKLNKKYYKEVEKVLGSNTAARFTQLENQIGLLIDIQLASEMPLIGKSM